MKYEIKEKTSKYFRIDLGLRPGYEESQNSFSVEDIKAWYVEWQQMRTESNQPTFAGVVTETSFVYPHEGKGMMEPAARIEGEVMRKYHESIFDNDEEILRVIRDLAEMLGFRAKQERVHIVFCDRSYVLENQ
ncbi:MAG: hypothetical protein ABIT47_02260 [Candidatus Paceibacterota bacterium]